MNAPAASTPAADNPAGDSPFHIVSIRSTRAPTGNPGHDWFTYCIAQGPNQINGYRRGDLEAVTFEVERIVAALNERRGGRRGRVELKPNRRPPAPASGA